MNQRGFPDVLRILFNSFAAVALVMSMLLRVGGGGPMETAAFFPMFMYIFSIPTGALAFLVLSQDMLEGVANPYAQTFLIWAPFFVLGWLQWAIILPGLCWIVGFIRKGGKSAA